jgi:hypothetical protein
LAVVIAATDSLLMGGVYRLAEWGGLGKNKGNDAKYPYSFLGALKYAFLLIFLLWRLELGLGIGRLCMEIQPFP